MLKLSDTVSMMVSDDYKQRFVAEYYQLWIRRSKLQEMIEKWDSGKLDFIPSCPKDVYKDQIYCMNDYITVLECRAKIEGIELNLKNIYMKEGNR
jgi:hypothetical protein